MDFDHIFDDDNKNHSPVDNTSKSSDKSSKKNANKEVDSKTNLPEKKTEFGRIKTISTSTKTEKIK